MIKQLEFMKKDRLRTNNGSSFFPPSNFQPSSTGGGRMKTSSPPSLPDSYEVVALHVSPDLGERIMLSSERNLLDEIFPETNQSILDVRSGVAWNQMDGRQIIRFPLNGYCKLNSVQVLTRLLNSGFTIEASTGGGVEGQQFSEYLLVRKTNQTSHSHPHPHHSSSST